MFGLKPIGIYNYMSTYTGKYNAKTKCEIEVQLKSERWSAIKSTIASSMLTN